MPSINRNIVECKGETAAHTSIWRLVLIETSWNVKKVESDTWRGTEYVLIETSWNVKVHQTGFRLIRTIVLIETSWNVK